MKKLAITLLLAVTSLSGLRAQDYIFDNPDNHRYLGVRAALDITALQSPGDIYSNRAGFELGAVYNIPLWKNLYFEPGVSVFYNTMGIKSLKYGPDYSPKGHIDNWGFRIPLNVGFRFDVTDDISVIPYTGPGLNLNLSSKATFDGAGNLQPNIDFNTIDLGWNFGVGVGYKRCLVAIGGTVGMTHYIKQEPLGYYARRNVFSITLGYNF